MPIRVSSSVGRSIAAARHEGLTIHLSCGYNEGDVNKRGSSFRGAMFSRDVLKNGICFIAAAALLLAVMSSPIRPPCPVGEGSPSDCLRRNLAVLRPHSARRFVVLPNRSTRLSALSVASPPNQVKAVRSEGDEEEIGRTVSLPCCMLALPPAPSFPRVGGLAPFTPAREIRPLRC